MSSFSGGTNHAGQTSTNKIKTTHSNIPTPGFQLVGKNGKLRENSINPVSPNFQQLINNHPPPFDVSNTAYDYNLLSPHTQSINTTSPMVPTIMISITAALMSTISVRLPYHQCLITAMSYKKNTLSAFYNNLSRRIISVQ
jgi:hypothetical protein